MQAAERDQVGWPDLRGQTKALGEEALARLDEQIIHVLRLDEDDPIAVWRERADLADGLLTIVLALVAKSLMQKATLLSDGERQILETHAKTGAELLSRTKVSYGELAEDIARHHHERWDGAGYPDGLSGENIPLIARILCIADVFDALTTDRSYRSAFSQEEALTIMESEAGKMIDPELFAVFINYPHCRYSDTLVCAVQRFPAVTSAISVKWLPCDKSSFFRVSGFK